MKFTFHKTAAAAAIAASLALTACVDSTSFPTVPPVVTPDPGKVTLTGTATKGDLIGADIYACLASATACLDAEADTIAGLAVASDVSTAEGYSIDLPAAAFGKAIVIRVFANATTTQECDYSDCVENEDLTGLTLSTVTFVETPAEGTTATVDASMSVLSTLATDTLLDSAAANAFDNIDAAGLDAVTSVASKSVATLLGIDATNSETDTTPVNLFKIKLPSATATKIGNAAAQGSVSADTIKKLALVNASFGTLVEKDSTGTVTKTLAAAIKTVSTQVKKAVNTTAEQIAAGTAIDLSEVTKAVTKIKTETVKKAAEVSVPTPKVVEADKIVDKVKEALVDKGVDVVDIVVTGTTGSTNTGASN